MRHIHYQIVFRAKCGKAIMDEGVGKDKKETADGMEDRYAIQMKLTGCDQDHIHLSILFGIYYPAARRRLVHFFPRE